VSGKQEHAMDADPRNRTGQERTKEILLGGVIVIVFVAIEVLIHVRGCTSRIESGEADSREIEARDADIKAITSEMTIVDVRKRLGVDGHPSDRGDHMYEFRKAAYGRYIIIVTLDEITGKVAATQYWSD
jgi:hypothetical protein